tara:strand:+ start:313 stop:669 length:357 start_codon:yes stop_codon:yes gene_type:complete
MDTPKGSNLGLPEDDTRQDLWNLVKTIHNHPLLENDTKAFMLGTLVGGDCGTHLEWCYWKSCDMAEVRVEINLGDPIPVIDPRDAVFIDAVPFLEGLSLGNSSSHINKTVSLEIIKKE